MPENNKLMSSSSSSLPVPVRGIGAASSQQQGGRTSASNVSPAETRLKKQLDDCERRRKNLVIQSQKASRENEVLQRKYKQIAAEHEGMKKSHEATTQELSQLKRVSEAVYKEYETLLRRFDMETGAMHKAMEKASDWYKQNRALKRQSAILVQKFLQVSPDSIAELDESSTFETSETSDNNGDELDSLRRSVKELSSESARLQVELNAARLEEFEAQEQLIETSTKLENEHKARVCAEEELAELKVRNNALASLATLEAEELAALRDKFKQEKHVAVELRKEADKARKERNVLAHQSSLLLADIVGDQRVQMLILEIESLKSKLEEENNKSSIHIQELQDKIFELQSENKSEMLEERLKLVETELECEQQRAARAELQVKDLLIKVKRLDEQKLHDETSSIAPPPPPPLPPVPSPPPAFRDTSSAAQHVVKEMENMLGIKSTTLDKKLQKSPSLQGGAIDEIIDQIKGGRFTLRSPGKQPRGQQEQPAAVQEMLQILGTMKRGSSRKPFTPV